MFHYHTYLFLTFITVTVIVIIFFWNTNKFRGKKLLCWKYVNKAHYIYSFWGWHYRKSSDSMLANHLLKGHYSPQSSGILHSEWWVCNNVLSSGQYKSFNFKSIPISFQAIILNPVRITLWVSDFLIPRKTTNADFERLSFKG